MQTQQHLSVDSNVSVMVVDAIEESTLASEIEGLTPVTTAYMSQDLGELALDDESDVTDKSFIAARSKPAKTEVYSLFKVGDTIAHIFVEGSVVQDDEGVLLPNGMLYDAKFHILTFGRNQLQIPRNCELGVGETELGIVFGKNADPVIVSFASGKSKLSLGPTSINWGQTTNGCLDERGILAFDLADGVAVLNLLERSVKCGPYRATYNPIDLPLTVLRNGLIFGDNMSFDFQRGIIKMGTNTIKVPWESALNITEDGVEVQVNDAGRGSSRRLSVSKQGDTVIVSGGDNTFKLPHKTSIVLDKQGHLAFELNEQFVLVQLALARAQVGGIGVQFEKGATLQVVRGMLKFAEGVFLNGPKRLLRCGESRIALPRQATVSVNKDQIKLEIKKREITMIPSSKQIYVCVAGKWIVLTITVGIAVDQNGNLAFDYRGNLAVMDTNAMILNVDGVKLDLSKAGGVAVELIGSSAIVSAQPTPTNFLDLLKEMMSGKGLLDLVKLMGDKMSPEALVELLLSVSSPEQIVSILEEAGIAIEGAVLDLLKDLLASSGGISAMMGQAEGVDASSLMMLTSTDSGTQLQIGGRMISMPSSMEMAEALTVGGAEVMLARIKGKQIELMNVHSAT